MKKIGNFFNNVYSEIVSYSSEELDLSVFKDFNELDKDSISKKADEYKEKPVSDEFIQEKFLEENRYRHFQNFSRNFSEYDKLFVENLDVIKKLPLLNEDILDLYSEAKRIYKEKNDLSFIKKLIDGGMLHPCFTFYRFSDKEFGDFVRPRMKNRFYNILNSSMISDCLENLRDPFYRIILEQMAKAPVLIYTDHPLLFSKNSIPANKIINKAFVFLNQIYFLESANKEIYKAFTEIIKKVHISDFVPQHKNVNSYASMEEKSEKAFQNLILLIKDYNIIAWFESNEYGHTYMSGDYLPEACDAFGRIFLKNIKIRMEEAESKGDMVAAERLQLLAETIENKLYPTPPSRKYIALRATEKFLSEKKNLRERLTTQEENEIAKRLSELTDDPKNSLPLVIEAIIPVKANRVALVDNKEKSTQIS